MKIRLMCVVLTITIMFSMTTSLAQASELTGKTVAIEAAPMDALDVMIAAFRTLAASSDDETPIWNFITGIAAIEPLYNLECEVIAFYLGFEPSGYAIVNNNIANPVILEFSTSSYPELDILIKDREMILNQDANSVCICYGGASNLFTMSDALTYVNSMNVSSKSSNESALGLDGLYSYMSSVNAMEYSKHMSIRGMIEERYSIESVNMQSNARSSYTLSELKEMYHMIDWDDMPTDTSYYTRTIHEAVYIDYGTTSEFSGVNGAENHCAATAAFNVIAYYSAFLDQPELFVNGDRIQTFTAIHEYIGNGPVTFLGYNNGLSNYVEDRGRTYHYELGGTYEAVKSGINSNHISTILMKANIINWHMVIAVGYREYSTGTNYIRIVNGWENSAYRFILSNHMVGSYTTWIT